MSAAGFEQELLWTRNCLAVSRDEIPSVEPGAFREICTDACTAGARLAALTVLRQSTPPQKPSMPEILAVLADDARSRLGLLRMALSEEQRYPALTPGLPQAQAFERELWEDHGIHPEGHPWLKPLRRHADLEEPDRAREPRSRAPHEFFRVEGAGIHEVAVGPVHAGIIEPGHFRFQCRGESVLNLEIQLGYQHRGAEDLFLRSAAPRRLVIAESIAGDTVIGHATAYCAATEAAAGIDLPLSAQGLRGVALELERASNHVGDLGALCNDVGFLPGASWFGRLRGEFLNLLTDLSGNRFGRSLSLAGGVRFGLTSAQRKDFLERLGRAERDLRSIAEVTFDSPSVGSRLENTGVVAQEVARVLGLVGPVVRASGVDLDVRRDHPSGFFRFAHIPVAVGETGDVMARALVRWIETQRSIGFLREQISELSDGALSVEVPPARPQAVVVSMVEGWRGEITHVLVTGHAGRIAGYKIVDPSFHNWFGLAIALRGNQISDFPLCNKSFNLSYAGHDL